MIFAILSAAFILVTVFLNVKHAWAILTIQPNQADMFTRWNFSRAARTTFGLLTLAAAILILLPDSFVAGNLINAGLILLLIGLHLKDRNIKSSLMEIPFLLLPFVMIYLKYPLHR
jgi:hypothetical protein